MKAMQWLYVQLVVLFGLLSLAGVAGAAAVPIVVTDVTDQIASTLTPIGLIGAGVLLVIVGIKTYKWVRRAM